MGFRIFAAGNPDFHYENDKCIDQGDFDTVDLISKMQGLDGTKMGAFATGVDVVQPSAGLKDLAAAWATMESLHLLKTSVTLLAMLPGSGDGWISVTGYESHLFWPDTVRNARYGFTGDDPGTAFVKRIAPMLKETNLNNWGVLLQLAKTLSQYETKVSSRPIINIQLFH